MARKKKVYKDITINELSNVDKPAQEPAKALIIKRATDEEVLKASFVEVLGGMKIHDKVREAMEEMWEFNEALRTSISKIMRDDDNYPNKITSIKTSLTEFSSAVSTMIDGLSEDIQKAAMKTEAGKKFPAKDYAYTPDKNKPSTWKLRLTSTPGATPDVRIVGAATAALGKGFRGNKVNIPAAALAGVKNKVRAAWKKALMMMPLISISAMLVISP